MDVGRDNEPLNQVVRERISSARLGQRALIVRGRIDAGAVGAVTTK